MEVYCIKRIPWFDNIKGILIFLVVFGHLIEAYRGLEGNEVVKYLYDTVYFFHMPLFIMISGYFFRPNKFERVVQLIGVFLIWHLINGLISPLVKEQAFVTFTSESRILSIFSPYWTMWYLLGVIVWTVITPYVLRFKYPLLITIAMAILITFAEDVTKWFSLRKLVNFYPYFLIGYFLAEKKILINLAKKAATWKMPLRWGALSVIIAFLAGMVYFTTLPNGTVLTFMRESYSFFGWGLTKGAIIQVAMYASVAILSVALMMFVPFNRVMPFFNTLGIYSIYIYLMHTIFVRILRETVPPYIVENPMLLIGISVVLALMITWFASLSLVRRIFRPLVEPSLKWVLKGESSKEKNRSKERIA